MWEILKANTSKDVYFGKWYIYIAECRDKTLYTGIAKDLDKRLHEHNHTSKCRYTRFRKPLKLVYQETCLNYSIARKRESEVKKFSRRKKLQLVENLTYLWANWKTSHLLMEARSPFCVFVFIWQNGGMAERSNAAVLKTVVGLRPPWVRILLPPPL